MEGLRGLRRSIWEDDLAAIPQPRRTLIVVVRTAILMYDGFFRQQLTTRASSLTYTTLFSLIPTLAVGFAIFDAFGGVQSARNQLLPWIIDYLAVGVRDQAAERIASALDNLDSGALGAVGSLFLIVTTLSLLNSIEYAFNGIWGVSKTRGYVQRLTVYWTMVTVIPLLVLGGLSLPAAISHYGPFSWVFDPNGAGAFVVGRLMPPLLIWVGFTLMYWLLVSVRIPLRAAAIGGLGGGLVWWLAISGYARYVRHSFFYSVVYGPLGAILVFLFWLYLSWVIVLLGALLAYASENLSAFREERMAEAASPRALEVLAIAVMAEIAARFECGAGGLTREELREQLHASGQLINHAVDQLRKCGWVQEVNDKRELAPARSPANMQVAEVLDGLRTVGTRSVIGVEAEHVQAIEKLWDGIELAAAGTLEGKTFADLARELPPRQGLATS